MNDPRETLARIRKQADNATEGPWVCTLNGDESEVTYANAPITWDDHGGEVFTEGDAEFIAAARTTVPALLDLAEAVLKRHVEGRTFYGHGFSQRMCECGASWPCPDYTAATAALEKIA